MPDAIAIEKASIDQLRHFAETRLGVPVPAGAKRDAVLALIQQAGHSGPITAPAGPGRVVGPASNEPDDLDAYVEILIQRQEGAGGGDPVWVSVNGRGLFIERGKPQKIRRKYLHVLENATATVYEQEAVTKDIVPREVPRYPFSVLRVA